MARVGSLLAVLLLVFYSSPSLAKLTGGNFKDIQMTLLPNRYTNQTCRIMGLYGGGHTSQPRGHINVTKGEVPPNTHVHLVLTVYEVKCANFELGKFCMEGFPDGYVQTQQVTLLASNTLNTPPSSFNFHPNDTKYIEAPTSSTSPTSPTSPTTPTSPTSTTSTTTSIQQTTSIPPANGEGGSGKQRRAVLLGEASVDDGDRDRREDNTPQNIQTSSSGSTEGQGGNNPSKKPLPLFNVTKDAIYVVQVAANLSAKPPQNITVFITYDLQMETPFGFLSAVDYPALIFYSIMMVVYGIYGVVWIILMACSYKDLVRLQFWIGAVIILGFLEKTFFVSEYSSVNLGNDSSGLNIVAEGVSAAKRALARMLLIIVSLGFGTVKPRLGDSLGKVVAAGVIYFVFALIEGIVRTRSNTSSTNDTSSLVTLALLLFLDVIIFYWVFTSLVATRRALRLRKNYVKLSLYNHFAYTLIFAVIATIGFLVWVFLDLNYPRDDCLTDWKEVWLRDCYWHILFAFILVIVMILWRPSSNRIRFAYSLVTDHDEDQEEPDQENKNFETVKMRTVTKPGSETPVVTSAQAEDDLRWVEENLPTTAVDKALPFVLDSDEEVMTTRFEMSKMN